MGELDICISRVVDLTPDNRDKEEHASHQQAIKSAYQKLNLIVQGQKPYAPNYIWKNHWGQLPVNPYTKPTVQQHPSSTNGGSQLAVPSQQHTQHRNVSSQQQQQQVHTQQQQAAMAAQQRAHLAQRQAHGTP